MRTVRHPICMLHPRSAKCLSFMSWNVYKRWIRHSIFNAMNSTFFATIALECWSRKNGGEFTFLKEYNCVSGAFRYGIYTPEKKDCSNTNTTQHYRQTLAIFHHPASNIDDYTWERRSIVHAMLRVNAIVIRLMSLRPNLMFKRALSFFIIVFLKQTRE